MVRGKQIPGVPGERRFKPALSSFGELTQGNLVHEQMLPKYRVSKLVNIVI